MGATRILVVSSFVLLREGVCALLRRQAHWQVSSEDWDMERVQRVMVEWQPDVVILDVVRVDDQAARLVRAIRSTAQGAGIVVLSREVGGEGFFQLVRAGACGWLDTCSGGSDLVAAVRAAASGNAYLCPGAACALLRAYRRQHTDVRRSQP